MRPTHRFAPIARSAVSAAALSLFLLLRSAVPAAGAPEEPLQFDFDREDAFPLPLLSGTARRVPGEDGGGALAFDGTAGPLAFADAPGLRFGPDESFTIEFRVRPATDDTQARQTILCKHDPATGSGWDFRLNTKGRLAFYARQNSAVVTVNFLAPGNALGQWHHVAFVRDAAEGMVRYYVDHKLLYERDAPRGGGNPFDQPGPLCLGGGSSPDDRFEGLLDDLRFTRHARRDFREPETPGASAPARYQPAPTLTEPPDAEVAASWQEIDRLGLPIVPCPKSFRADGEPLPLDGTWQVVLLTPGAEAGLAEISNRFAAAGVDWATGRPAGEPPAGRIVAGRYPDMAAFLGRIGNPPCPPRQGYVIGFAREEGRPLCVIAGADLDGTRYGCVTLAAMARPGSPPNLVQAAVRDWPDYRLRMGFGLSGASPARLKPVLDQIFRAKINLAWGYGFYESFESLLETAAERREIYRYAAERGIRVVVGGRWDVGEAPFTEDFRGFSKYFYPYKTDEGLIGKGGWAYTWSRDDLITAKGRLLAQFMAETGADAFFLHCMDTGGRDNPENWANRTAMDRERWGDDRAAADANVIRLLHAEMKRQNPEVLFFPVIYPYSPRYLQYPDVRTWLDRLSSLVPEEVFFDVREAPRELMQQWKDVIRQGRHIYHEPYKHGYGLMCDAAGRYARTFFFDDRDAYWFCSSSTDQPARWVAAEYAWNTQAPGWGWLPADYGTLPQADASPAEVTDRLLPRITAILFGPSAAQRMAGVYRQRLPVRLMVNLRVLTGADPEAYFEVKHAAAVQAVAQAEAAVAQADPPFEPAVRAVRDTVVAVRHLIEARHRYFVCRRLLAGERLEDATREASLARAALEQIAPDSAWSKSHVPVLRSDLDLAGSVQWRRERRRHLEALPPTEPFAVGLYSLGYYRGWEDGLAGVPGIRTATFADPTRQELQAFDVIVFPAANDLGDTSEDWRENVQQFVARGGGVIFSHNSVGRIPSSAFGKPLFPNVCAGPAGVVAGQPTLAAAAAHPALGALQPGGTLEQEYTDHLSLRPGPEGKVLLCDNLGNPVLVVGTYGQGRVVYTGQIFGVTKRNEQRGPEGGEWFLLYHLLRWCAGSGQEL